MFSFKKLPHLPLIHLIGHLSLGDLNLMLSRADIHSGEKQMAFEADSLSQDPGPGQ